MEPEAENGPGSNGETAGSDDGEDDDLIDERDDTDREDEDEQGKVIAKTPVPLPDIEDTLPYDPVPLPSHVHAEAAPVEEGKVETGLEEEKPDQADEQANCNKDRRLTTFLSIISCSPATQICSPTSALARTTNHLLISQKNEQLSRLMRRQCVKHWRGKVKVKIS